MMRNWSRRPEREVQRYVPLIHNFPLIFILLNVRLRIWPASYSPYVAEEALTITALSWLLMEDVSAFYLEHTKTNPLEIENFFFQFKKLHV